MKKIILGLGFLLSLSTSASSGQLDSLIAEATQSTNVLITPNGDYHVLSNIVPADPKVTHQADYISAVGLTDKSGRFHPGLFAVVSEHWVKNGNEWDVDQWMFYMSLDGTRVSSVTHSNLREDYETRDVLPSTNPPPPTDIEAQKHIKDIIGRWLARRPI